jgi:hypothetical protein
MSVLDFQRKRMEFANQILNLGESNEDVLEKMMAYFILLKKKDTPPPCRFTVEEMKAEIERGWKAYEEGIYSTHEEMREKYRQWM